MTIKSNDANGTRLTKTQDAVTLDVFSTPLNSFQQTRQTLKDVLNFTIFNMYIIYNIYRYVDIFANYVQILYPILKIQIIALMRNPTVPGSISLGSADRLKLRLSIRQVDFCGFFGTYFFGGKVFK